MSMRFGVIGVCLGVAVLILGCGNDGSEYSGFSEMVADRHDVRRAVGEDERAKRRKTTEAQEPGVRQGQAVSNSVPSGGSQNPFRKKEKRRLYERHVLIMDASSKQVLARGVAHVDKGGNVVRLRISKK